MSTKIENLINLEKELKNILKKLFNQEILNRKELKKKIILDPSLKPLPGLDRVKIFIHKESIKPLESCKYRIERLNISGENFSKLKSGVYRGNWWCHLDVNLPKVLYGHNLKNIRSKTELINIMNILEKELEIEHSLKVNLLEGYFYSIELNVLLILEKEFSKYSRAISRITFYLLKGIFKRKGGHFNEFKKFSGISYGTKNKYLTIYNKSLEQLYRKFGDQRWYQDLSKAEIMKVIKKYMTLARLEFSLKGDPLVRFIPKSISLSKFIEDSEGFINLIYSELISESGLNSKSFEVNKEKRKKSLKNLFKRYVKKWPKLFILKFINENQNQIIGYEQAKEIIEDLGGTRGEVQHRLKSFKKEFKNTKSMDGSPLEAWDELHEFIEKINESM